jgi:hypothetical protein
MILAPSSNSPASVIHANILALDNHISMPFLSLTHNLSASPVTLLGECNGPTSRTRVSSPLTPWMHKIWYDGSDPRGYGREGNSKSSFLHRFPKLSQSIHHRPTGRQGQGGHRGRAPPVRLRPVTHSGICVCPHVSSGQWGMGDIYGIVRG